MQEKLTSALDAERGALRARADAEALTREAEHRCATLGETKAQLVRATTKIEELETLRDSWKEEWERVKSGHRAQIAELSDTLQALHAKLRGEATVRTNLQERLTEMEAHCRRHGLSVLTLEHQLGEARSQGRVDRERDTAREAALKETLAETRRTSERVVDLTESNARLSEQLVEMTQRLRSAEEALAAARTEHVDHQARELQRDSDRRAQALSHAAQAANATMLGSHGHGNELDFPLPVPPRPAVPVPASVDTYIRVLEGALREQLGAAESQRSAVEEARYLEGQARALLADARAKEVEAKRQLSVEMARLTALERGRLKDVAEMQEVERKWQAGQEEAWRLRDLLAAERRATGGVLAFTSPGGGVPIADTSLSLSRYY